MRTIVVTVLLLALAGPAQAQGFRTYVDETYGTTALVPADWRKLPADERWNGTRFISPDDRSWLAVYGSRHSRATVGAHMDAIASVEGEKVTYTRREQRWIVVAGRKGERIFYRKAILTCDDSVWHHIAFEYPAEMKEAFDHLVTRVSQAFKASDQRCD